MRSSGINKHKKPESLVAIELQQLIQLKAEARGFSFLPRQPVQSLLAGRHASRLRGRGLAFEELRHYSQGDDARTIDWKATARLRSPHVRVYSEERERPVLLVVDQRKTMFFGSRRAMKSVVAAELCALGAWRTLHSGDRVGGIVFNDQQIVDLRPQRSQTAVLRLLHEVTQMNHALTQKDPRPATVTLNQALEAAARRAHHDYLVVVISDLDVHFLRLFAKRLHSGWNNGDRSFKLSKFPCCQFPRRNPLLSNCEICLVVNIR